MNTKTNLNRMVDVRNKINQKQSSINDNRKKVQALFTEVREIKNWLAGNPVKDVPEESNRAYLGAVREKNEELQAIINQIDKLNISNSDLESEINSLRSIEFTNDDAMALAMEDHQRVLDTLNSMRQDESLMKAEQRSTESAISDLLAKKMAVQKALNAALSANDIAKLGEDEAKIQQNIDRLQVVISNIQAKLSRIAHSITEKKAEIEVTEPAVWKARFVILTKEIYENPHFKEIGKIMEAAFAAWLKAGHGYSPERFLNEILNQDSIINFDPDHIAAHQTELAKRIGLHE